VCNCKFKLKLNYQSTGATLSWMSATHVSRHAARSQRRRARERTIIGATRALFDERGRREAPIDEIAHAARLNKALIYRSFDSKA